MRLLSFLVMLTVLLGVTILGLENRAIIPIQFFGQSFSSAHATLIGVVFVLGMIMGGFAITFIRHLLWGTIGEGSA